MQSQAGRIAGFVALLAVLWIVVYWGWPAGGGKISFASGASTPKPGVSADPSPRATVRPVPSPSAPILPSIESKPSGPASQPPERTAPREAPSKVTTPLAVIPPQFIEHTVRPSETLTSISIRYFGTSGHVDAILRANPYLDPRRLRPGRVIKVPKDPENIQGKPVEPAPPASPPGSTPDAGPQAREYVVQPGDTLSGIASDVYGSAAMAREIYQANRDVMTDEDSLRVGMKLRLPPKPQ